MGCGVYGEMGWGWEGWGGGGGGGGRQKKIAFTLFKVECVN